MQQMSHHHSTTSTANYRQLLNFIEVFELNGSGWVFSHFQDLQLTLWQLDQLRGSTYIPLARWIQTRRAVVNVAGTGDACSKWAILAGVHPVDANAHRRVKYFEHMGRYDFSSLSFPAPLQAVGPFALRNNMSINVYGVDDDKEVIYPTASHPHPYQIDIWICYCSNMMVYS